MRITYCAERGFHDPAASLAAAIEKRFDLSCELIEGRDGIYEVVLGDVVVFSNRGKRGKLFGTSRPQAA